MLFVCGWRAWQRPTFQWAHQMVDSGLHIDDPKTRGDSKWLFSDGDDPKDLPLADLTQPVKN
jgi:hypothetical protein